MACIGCDALPHLPTEASPAPATAGAQNASLDDYSIQFNPDVAKPGVPCSEVEAVLGQPDATLTLGDDQAEALYAFFPDGGKFVNPGVGTEFFSHSAASAVRSPHLEALRNQLTFYRIRYSVDGVITSVTVDRPNPGLSQPAF